MKYLWDTNTCIVYLAGQEHIKKKVATLPEGIISISFITAGELYYGAYFSSKRESNLRKLKEFCSFLEVLPACSITADIYGRLKSELRQKGKLIEDNDIVIAATAIQHRLILVTDNTGHFSRISELVLENWCHFCP